MYKYLLFDADGTVLDFDAAEEFSFFYTLGQYEITATEDMFTRYKQINRKLWQDLEAGVIKKSDLITKRFKDFFEEFNIKRSQYDFNEDYLKNLSQKSFLIPHAFEVMQNLAKEYKIIIVTNGVAKTQFERLHASTLMPFISDVIVSETTGFLKPDEGFFKYTFIKCDIENKSEVIIIGDSLTADMRGGADFGITTCWFNPKKVQNDMGIKINHEITDLRDIYAIVGSEIALKR